MYTWFYSGHATVIFSIVFRAFLPHYDTRQHTVRECIHKMQINCTVNRRSKYISASTRVHAGGKKKKEQEKDKKKKKTL